MSDLVLGRRLMDRLEAMAMASVCPVAMLFVRRAGGISHHPAESITLEDADAATRVLLHFLRAHTA